MDNLENRLKEIYAELYNALYKGDFTIISKRVNNQRVFVKIEVKGLKIVVGVDWSSNELWFYPIYEGFEDISYYTPELYSFFNYDQIVIMRKELIEHLKLKLILL
ncbi:MAG: hypothetical protein MJ009_00690 [Paludibacteraceae bacterium]|nr:hypothetical protein [Paludibacteraceae bacterium]